VVVILTTEHERFSGTLVIEDRSVNPRLFRAKLYRVAAQVELAIAKSGEEGWSVSLLVVSDSRGRVRVEVSDAEDVEAVLHVLESVIRFVEESPPDTERAPAL
jgi:hypothetical protein